MRVYLCGIEMANAGEGRSRRGCALRLTVLGISQMNETSRSR